ncbi:nuclease-related domain-containing DEAD/DEAH box helicase [Glutamicibacter mysorens]|uniref:nuclease-related domain-containing DEAD/DEAH box helicase n=1 Tax=Glutamicibacter mysorens TaxID=257984 RepID=UPI0020C6F66C|nr:NERD domain-containing protein [Glutamicibacter mysorens]UTM46163.1 NERD domain-containing protein [Glutamicibacter mysorens]
MMVRCYPQEPEFTDKTAAEKKVWEVLRRDLPDDALLFHSVQLRHQRAEHEIDLLVLLPGVGVAVIEVKGGLVSVENGTWYQSGAKDKHPLKESPMAQVQSASHALRELLGKHMGSRFTSRIADLVCFPYTDWPADYSSVGLPRDLVIDRGQVESLVTHVHHAIDERGAGSSTLAPEFAERMIRHLNGDTGPLGATPAEVDYAQAMSNEDIQETLTARQSILLSCTRSLKRVQFLGSAGSGKTWMALRKAKELAKEDKRVGLFCYNKGLGLYLQSEVGTWRQNKPVHVGEFHEYARKLGVPDGTGQEYFEVELPQHLLALSRTLPEEEKLDAVIVDEAQDFAGSWWEALLACTKDPANGDVYAFMDDRQDVYQRWDGQFSGDGMPLVPIHVDDNLRNTRRIADTFKQIIGNHSKLRGGEGYAVRYVNCATEDAVDVASDCVDALLDEGWANNQIALLTTNRRHPIHQDHFENGTIDSEYWPAFHRDEEEFYGHVLGFKGLERSVVILCVNGFKDMQRATEQLYVGFSRARSLLVVVGEKELIDEASGANRQISLDAALDWWPSADTVSS